MKPSNRQLAREFLSLSATGALWQGSALATRLLAARIIGPAEFGVWNMLSLVLSYGGIVSLGATSAMTREIPMLRARGDDHLGEIALYTTWSVNLVAAVVVYLALTSLAVLSHSQLMVPLQLTLMLFAADQAYNFFQMLLRAEQRFRMYALQQACVALAMPAIALPLATGGLGGFITAQFIVLAAASAVISKRLSFKPTSLRYTWQMYRRLIERGLPIVVVGFLWTVLISIDRWLIVRYLGVNDLGLYTVNILTLTAFSLPATVLSVQLFPRMAEALGRNVEAGTIQTMALRAAGWGVLLGMGMAVVMFVAVPPLVRTWLPSYAGGIESFRIGVWAGVAFPPATILGNYFNLTQKSRYCLYAVAIAIPAEILVAMQLIRLGYGLSGVAAAAVLAAWLYTILLTLFRRR